MKAHCYPQSGRYPLCGRGDVNTYTIFAQDYVLAHQCQLDALVALCLLVSLLMTPTKYFFQNLVTTLQLASYAYMILKIAKAIFHAVIEAIRFRLLTFHWSRTTSDARCRVCFLLHTKAITEDVATFHFLQATFPDQPEYVHLPHLPCRQECRTDKAYLSTYLCFRERVS